jgi:hypothetical protein
MNLHSIGTPRAPLLTTEAYRAFLARWARHSDGSHSDSSPYGHLSNIYYHHPTDTVRGIWSYDNVNFIINVSEYNNEEDKCRARDGSHSADEEWFLFYSHIIDPEYGTGEDGDA